MNDPIDIWESATSEPRVDLNGGRMCVNDVFVNALLFNLLRKHAEADLRE